MWLRCLVLYFKKPAVEKEVDPILSNISTIHKNANQSQTKDKLVDVEEKKLVETNFSDITPLNTSSEKVCLIVIWNLFIVFKLIKVCFNVVYIEQCKPSPQHLASLNSICSQLGSGKVEVSMETVLHSHEDTEKKTSGEKKKGRERGKVNWSRSVI